MILINDTWWNIKSEEDMRQIISEHISPEVAACFDNINSTWKDKYEELEYSYDQLQEEYDLLECEYDDLESRNENLEEENKKLEDKVQTIIYLLRSSDYSDSECCIEIGNLCGIAIE